MERVMSELANYFVSLGSISVHLVLHRGVNNQFYDIDHKVYVHVRKERKENKIFQFFRTLWFIRTKVTEINPDAVLSFGIQWNNLLLLSLLGTKNKVFVSDRGSPIRKYEFPQMTLRKYLYPFSSGIIAQTEMANVLTTKMFPKLTINTIGNPINCFYNQSKINNKENIILSIGRLIDSKHHINLITIFSKLNAQGWKLIIVGGNSLKQNNYEKLKCLINNKGLEGKVILDGARKDVLSYYERSQIFAFTSSVEGFPNVVGEALSAGLPVVSYDCVAGPSEMITDGANGFLVPVFDDELFRQRLQMLIDNEELRDEMGQKARESMKKFSVEEIGQQYINFIFS
ncbi:MAG: glycosyltransferase [Salinivirgaceae bacterium]|nr:glycosyltransferase [Salinivirgaceae bacterium]